MECRDETSSSSYSCCCSACSSSRRVSVVTGKVRAMNLSWKCILKWRINANIKTQSKCIYLHSHWINVKRFTDSSKNTFFYSFLFFLCTESPSSDEMQHELTVVARFVVFFSCLRARVFLSTRVTYQCDASSSSSGQLKRGELCPLNSLIERLKCWERVAHFLLHMHSSVNQCENKSPKRGR